MLWLAYLPLLASLLWLLARSLRPLTKKPKALVRVGMAVLAFGFAVLGAVLVFDLTTDPLDRDPLATLVRSLLLVASLLYTWGAIRWDHAAAYPLRLLGWVGISTLLTLPSTLTFALPLAAILVLGVFPSERALGRNPEVAHGR